MKYFMVLALCLTAVVAEELHERGVDFHTLHYGQHHQSVEEAKRKLGGGYSGQHAEFEEVGTYGGLGGVGIGTVGFSSSGAGGSSYGSSSGSNAEYSSSGSSSFDANYAASSSFGSKANTAFASGSQGSSSGASYLDGSTGQDMQHVVQDHIFRGGAHGHDSFGHHQEHLSGVRAGPALVMAPSAGSDKYYVREEGHISNAVNPVVYTVPVASQDSLQTYSKWSSLHPKIYVPSTSTFLHRDSSGSATGSQFDQVVSGATSNQNARFINEFDNFGASTLVGTGRRTGYGANKFDSTYGTESKFFGSDSAFGGSKLGSGSSFDSGSTFGGTSSSSGSKLGLGSSFDSGSTFGGTSSSSGSKLGLGSSFDSGSTYGSASSSRGSKFGLGTSFGSGSAYGGASSSTDLHQYMTESERLAKLQTQGMLVGASRVGGSHFNANSENSNSAGFGGFSGFGSAGAAGGAGSGYKSKSWESASKWSSQSAFGPDGQVNNYKELSTGDSENVDINGHRTGYKAATTTLDDNGKLSSYSLHT